MWYTRDDDGERALWIGRPNKDDWGEWWSWAGDAVSEQDDLMDELLGKGFHGLRKGGIMEIEVSWKPVKNNQK